MKENLWLESKHDGCNKSATNVPAVARDALIILSSIFQHNYAKHLVRIVPTNFWGNLSSTCAIMWERLNECIRQHLLNIYVLCNCETHQDDFMFFMLCRQQRQFCTALVDDVWFEVSLHRILCALFWRTWNHSWVFSEEAALNNGLLAGAETLTNCCALHDNCATNSQYVLWLEIFKYDAEVSATLVDREAGNVLNSTLWGL